MKNVILHVKNVMKKGMKIIINALNVFLLMNLKKNMKIIVIKNVVNIIILIQKINIIVLIIVQLIIN